MGRSRAVRILHVDDEPDFGGMTAEFLEREDGEFNIETATSVSEGLDLFSGNDFDCIISDYDMPGRNGIEFLEVVREKAPDLPFVLFTGKGSEEVASDAIFAGVTDYLQKGTGTDQYVVLANRVRNAVERYRAEQAHKRQRKAIETAQEGISILDEDGRYIYVNQAFADLHGYDPGKMIGERWKLAYPEDEIPDVRENIFPEVERRGYWHGETISRRSDGTDVVVDHTLALTDRGELVCTVRDVSERKDREQQIRQSNARLEALFENSPDMINIYNLDGNIIDPNSRLCEKTGYDAETLAEMKVWELDQTVDPDEVSATWERMDVGDRHRFEGRYKRSNGSTFPVEVHIRRLRLDGEDQIMAISRDLTDRKRQQRRLQRQLAQFEHFGSVLTHDLQTPLRTVEGRIELAQETGELSHLERADAAVQRLDVLIGELATVMREGELVDEFTIFDIGDAVRDVWELLPTDDTCLEIHGTAQIRGDTTAITRMLENLLKNVLEHGGKTVTVGVLADGFRVEDDGPGIPEDIRKEVFTLGYSTKASDERTGFGLASARQIAVAHGWELRVTDGHDGGARFEIRDVEFAG